MKTAPKIELRNIKHSAFASQETHCYEATLYVDGSRWGIVSNDGHGGCDRFHPYPGRSWNDITVLDKLIEETFPAETLEGIEIKASLETVCADLVNQWLQDREFARAMKSKVIFTKPGQAGVWQIAVKKPHSHAATLAAVKAKHPEYTYLSDLPVDQAMALYFA